MWFYSPNPRTSSSPAILLRSGGGLPQCTHEERERRAERGDRRVDVDGLVLHLMETIMVDSTDLIVRDDAGNRGGAVFKFSFQSIVISVLLFLHVLVRLFLDFCVLLYPVRLFLLTQDTLLMPFMKKPSFYTLWSPTFPWHPAALCRLSQCDLCERLRGERLVMVFHFVLFSVICLSFALFVFPLQKAFTMGYIRG